jgi:hypothetical protein
MSDEPDIQERVAQLLAPLREDSEALQAAITVHLHENVIRLANGSDDPLDVIEAELRHQAQAMIDPEGTLQKKLSALIDFLEQDIQHRLQQAAEEGLEARQKIGPIAAEATVDIHQLLTLAKKDLPGEVGPLLRARIETLEAHYTEEMILAKLRAFLGLDFVDEVRELLKEAIAEAQEPFDPSELTARVVVLHDHNVQVLDHAVAAIDEHFKSKRVREQVRHDLDALRPLFADEEALTEKLEPFCR